MNYYCYCSSLSHSLISLIHNLKLVFIIHTLAQICLILNFGPIQWKKELNDERLEENLTRNSSMNKTKMFPLAI